MSDPLSSADFQGASEATLDLILAEADKRIESQVQLMLASDARANGLLAASATLAAAALAVVGDRLKDHHLDALMWAAAVFLLFEVASAAACIVSIWPVAIQPKGWDPHGFIANIKAADPAETVKAELAAFTQARIRRNRRSALKASWSTRAAMVLLAAGPLAGLVAGASISTATPAVDRPRVQAQPAVAKAAIAVPVMKAQHGRDQHPLAGNAT